MLRALGNIVTKQSNKAIGASSIISRVMSSNADTQKKLMFTKVPKEDFGPYQEYSVIYTNRALNLMSDPFQKVMRDLNQLLKVAYNADKVAIIPGYVLYSFLGNFHSDL